MLKIPFITLILGISFSFSGSLPMGTSTKRIYDFSEILDKTWQGLYKRSVDAYDIKCVHRPNSELPHDCVSEGIGYGMILALYSNDQTGFNAIWDAGESYMWSGSAYNWRINESGQTIGTGAATDAEIDIAAMLIFADMLVQKGTWTAHTSPKGASYSSRAQDILNNLYNKGIDNNILLPGYGWGSSEGFWNPGYFAPAFFKVFDEFDSNANHDWAAIVDKCYQAIANNPGYAKGLLPDWAQHNGQLTPAGPGYNAFLNGDSFYKDAIRVLWRLGTDYAWYGDTRAKAFLENAMNFIGNAKNANFFNIDGTLYADTVVFTLGNGVTRPRKEHSHLTVGQWISTLTVAQDSTYIAGFLDEMHLFYDHGADYWGLSNDPVNGEDTLHNEMYFDQFLAWFGTSLISGKFQNVYEDIALPEGYVVADPRFVNWQSTPILNTKIQNRVVDHSVWYSPKGELINGTAQLKGLYIRVDLNSENQIIRSEKVFVK